MEVETSDRLNIDTTIKTDSQYLEDIQKTSYVKDDKSEVSEDNRNKSMSKTSVTIDGNGRRSSTNSPERISTTINCIPKAEFPFREASSIAVSDTNTPTNDLIETYSSEVEIKQEHMNDSLAILPSHAISKLQVSYDYVLFHKRILPYMVSHGLIEYNEKQQIKISFAHLPFRF